MVTLQIPERALVLLIGASGAGKSTFAHRHFKPTEIVSSDHCRALVCDDENDQTASRDAFQILRWIVQARLARGRLTVVDATNVLAASRKSLIAMAARHARPVVAIVLDLPEQSGGRNLPAEIIQKQISELKASLPELASEAYENVYVLETRAALDAVQIQREPV